MRRVTFRNRDIEIVGNLHLPEDFQEDGRYAALVLATPGSSEGADRRHLRRATGASRLRRPDL